MPKLLTVIGAAGVQGGSVLRAFASDPEWTLRGITRDLSSSSTAAAKAEFPSVTFVQADVNEPSTLTSAFHSSHTIFAVTQAFDPSITNNRTQETQQGRNIADAAVAANVSVLVWSTLPDTRVTSHGRYTSIQHTYLKADVTAYIRSLSPPFIPLFLLPASYIQNYVLRSILTSSHSLTPSCASLTHLSPFSQPCALVRYRFPPQRKDSTVVFSLPTSPQVKLDVVDISEWGKFIHTLLSSPDLIRQYVGKEVVACGERITGEEMARTYQEVTGETAKFETMDEEEFVKKAPDESHGKELLEMFQYYDEFGLFGNGDYDLMEGKKVFPFKTFREYLVDSKYRVGQKDEKYEM